jgi:hypothetical protein
VNGRVLHFYLAGINNQNFLMRDRETGTWWQQITGKAIYGPLQGAALELVLSDELTFGQWRTESPAGQVLAPVAKYKKEYDPNWEPDVAKLPVVISFPGTELKSRDVVIGLTINGTARAYPWETFVKQSPVVDRVNGTPLLVVLGPDGKSFRVFVSRIDGKDAEFFLQGEEPAEAQAGKTDIKSETKRLDAARHRHREPVELSGLRYLRPRARKMPRPHPRAQRLLVRLAQLPSRHDDLQTLEPAPQIVHFSIGDGFP